MSQNDPAVPQPAVSVLDELRRAVASAEAAAADLVPRLACGDGADAAARLEAELAPLAGLAAAVTPLPADVAGGLARLRDRVFEAAAAGETWLADAAVARRVRRAYGLPP